jgi:glycosyl hydrolase family 123
MMRPIALALFLTACSVPCTASESENLIPNAGFEVDTDRNGTPDGCTFAWQYTHSTDRERGLKKQKPQVKWDDTVVHSGRRSLFVANKRSEDDGVWTLADIPVDGNAKYYKLQAWIKTQNMEETEALVSGVFLGDGGKWLDANYNAVAVNTDRDWTRYTGYFQPPKGTTRIKVRLWLNMRYSGTGAVWYDDISLVPTDSIVKSIQRYKDDRPMPALTAEQQTTGYVCYVRDYLRLVFPTSVPAREEIGTSLSCFAAPGEREPVSFAIRALRDVNAVTVSCSSLETDGGETIGKEHISIRPVRYGRKEGQSRWGPFHTDPMVVPLYLASHEQVDVPAKTSQQVWVTVCAPAGTPPGHYRATVTVSAANAGTTQLPLEVEVLPIQLREPDHVYFGMYHRPVGDDDFRATAWRDMREHGMTSVGLCCNLGAQLTLNGDRVAVTFDGSADLERAVREYVDAGFTMPIDWLMGSDVLRWCKTQAQGDEQKSGDYYKQIIIAILDHGRQNQWPEIIFQPLDEPFEHTSRLDDTETCLRILKSIPGVRTEEDGPNGNPDTLERLYDLCDVLVYHDGPTLQRGTYDADAWKTFLQRLEKDDKEVWFYNLDLTGWHPEVLRFGYGFGLFQAGGTGVIQWSYQTAFNPDNPELVYQRPNTIIYQYPQVGSETGGPTLAWEATREGVDDYKYLFTLRKLVEELTARGNQRADRAQVLWREVEQDLRRIDFTGSTGSAAQGDWTGRKELSPEGDKLVSGDHKMANGLQFSDYNKLRRKIADAIIELTN